MLLITKQSPPRAVPAGERGEETAKKLFGCEDDITSYIVRLGFSVKNTTRSEVDAIHAGRRDRGAGAAGLQDQGTKR